MIICRPATIATVTASSENATYPDNNLLSPRPKLIWRAASSAVTSATLTSSLPAGVDSVVLLGVVASTVTLERWTGSSYAAPAGLVAADYVDSFRGTVAHWWTFTAMTGSVQLKITLTQTGSNVISATNLLAGNAATIDGVEYPLQESLVDTSIRAQLLDGSEYYKKRDIYRAFAGTIRADRAATVEPLLRAVCRTYGSVPMAVQIAPAVADAFLVYGRLGMAQASHAWPTVSQASFELVEVV